MASTARSPQKFVCSIAALTLGVAVAVPSGAHAAGLSWTRAEGADSCPSLPQVQRELELLLRRPLDGALEGRSLEVTVRRQSEQWTADLFWRAPDGGLLAAQSLRSAESSCVVFTTATLTSALVAIVTGVHPSDAAPVAQRTAQAVTSSSAPRAQQTNAPQPEPRPVPSRASWTTGDVALGAVAALYVMPAINGGVQLYVEPVVYQRLRVGASITALAESMLGLSVLAGFSAVEFGVDGCVRVTAEQVRFGVFPCAGVRAGSIAGFAYDAGLRNGGTQGSFAAQTSLLLRLELRPFVLSLDGALRWNVTRYTLHTTAGLPAVEQSPVGSTITFRFGVTIP